jgi:quinol monooxygenase YgiN
MPVARIVIDVRLIAHAGRRDDLLAAFDALHAAVGDEPGTEVFTMHIARDDPDVVVVHEVYRDDDALAAHQGSPALRDLVGTLGDLLAGPPEITYLEPVREKPPTR